MTAYSGPIGPILDELGNALNSFLSILATLTTQIAAKSQ